MILANAATSRISGAMEEYRYDERMERNIVWILSGLSSIGKRRQGGWVAEAWGDQHAIECLRGAIIAGTRYASVVRSLINGTM